MASNADTVHEVEILLKDLPTKSVTLAPGKATVVREINDVQIKPGPNEITIFGLDPFVDLDSIRVDGYGPATITDIRTDLVPRREHLEDILSDTDDENPFKNPFEENEPSDNPDDPSFETDEIKKTKANLQDLKNKLSVARDLRSSAVAVLGFLDQYGKGMDSKNVEVSKMTEFVAFYRHQRTIEKQRHQQSENEIEAREKEIQQLEKKLRRLQIAQTKSKDARESRRLLKEKNREKQRKRSERQRARNERKKFWTPQVSTVTVSLDGNSVFTPGSSRRNSVTSQKQTDLSDNIRLLLTYVVPRANWVPRYELSFKTPSSSAKLVYRAEFENSSSELWQNAKVSLSTSQTSFSGLSDKIPTLEGWHIKLVNVGQIPFRKGNVWDAGLQSQKETWAQQEKKSKIGLPSIQQYQQTNSNNANSNRNNQFPTYYGQKGNNSSSVFGSTAFGSTAFGSTAFGGTAFGSTAPPSRSLVGNAAPPHPDVASGVFGNAAGAAPTGSLFGAAPAGNAAPIVEPPAAEYGRGGVDAGSESDVSSESDTILGANPLSAALEHQESVRQDYGLTTTYDLPGQRTLAPSSIKRKHVLAELDLTAVTLSYIVVPKLRSAAFLKARIRNISSTTLLSGKAGMTVDGTFLGSTNLPSCAPNEFISLSLGVDPSILVNYAKPTVRRATTGFFNKEDSAIFTRTCWLKNTKSSVASISVLDQVPLSEDERLKVHIVEPKGLDKEGDHVKLDLSTKTQPKGAGVVVHLEKNGVVKWDVTLEKGKDVKLVLEYETRLPSGQSLVGLD